MSQPQEIVAEQPAPVAAPDLSDAQLATPDLSNAQPVAPVNEVEAPASTVEAAPQNAESAVDPHAAAVAKKERLTQLLKAEHDK